MSKQYHPKEINPKIITGYNKFASIFKNIFWPIEKDEVKLFVPMGLMMLCVLFNFGALRSVKDSLVVPNIGAEAISFLKLWLVLPSTVLFTIIYAWLSNRFNYEHLFYIIVLGFLGIFVTFAYLLYPNQDYLHLSANITNDLIIANPNFKWFILIGSKWSYALMYIFCELWSAVVINLLFWQYANHIFDTKSAKRFYPLLGMIGNIGLIIAGNFLIAYSSLSGVSDVYLADYATNTEFQCTHVVKPMINTIVASGIIAMMLYYYINNYVLPKHNLAAKMPSAKIQNTKTTLSLKESLRLIINSKYLGHIVMLILCYGLLINILEGPWKARVNELYPNTVDYMNFMGHFNVWMGISCVCFTIIGSNILRRTSWLFSALTTPLMLFVTGMIFFTFVIFADDFRSIGDWFHPIYFAVIIGAVQNILSKSTKYSLFDSTKEMAYIPLSIELKTKGKAAVEVIGLKFGKSLGAFIQSFIFMLFPVATFDSVTKYLMILFVIVVFIWVGNIRSLNEEYLKMQNNVGN